MEKSILVKSEWLITGKQGIWLLLLPEKELSGVNCGSLGISSQAYASLFINMNFLLLEKNKKK